MEEKIVYFDAPGKENTAEVLRLAKERAEARGINKIVLASTRGDTAKIAADFFAGSDIRMVVVPHQFGFHGRPQTFPPELVTELEKKGHRVHFGTMLFHSDNLYGSRVPTIMANLLRTFCQGIKVVVEIIWIACDGGLIGRGEKVIAVSGTGAGADTAVVAIAAPSTLLTELHILEIICKPLQTRSAVVPFVVGPPSPAPGTGSQQSA